MSRSVLRWMPWGAGAFACLPLLIGVSLFRHEPRLSPAGRSTPPSAVGTGAEEARLDSSARAALRIAPFRPDGRPSRIPYDPTRTEQLQGNEGAPKPQLVLTGILEGREPLAVVEGLPGRDGAVVMATGDTAGGLRIRKIKEGKVTLTGMDTTWTLTVRGAP